MTKPSVFSRDVTFDSTGFGQFTAPFTGEFWFVNAATTKVVLSKTGKTPQTLSANEVVVIHLNQGDEVGMTGTASAQVSVYDKFDVKLVPTAKDILGVVEIADSAGTLLTPFQTAGAANPTDTSKLATVALYAFDGTVWRPVQGGAQLGGAVNQIFATASGNTALLQQDGSIVQFPLFTRPFGSANVALQQDVSNNLKIAQQGSVSVKPLATLIEDEDLAPTSLAASSVEAIKVTGLTTLALGQRVNYNLSGEPGTVTGAGLFIYVAIKGATSGKYYAVCQSGSTVADWFDVPQAEKLNIVWRNSDATNAHVMSGHWTAMSP